MGFKMGTPYTIGGAAVHNANQVTPVTVTAVAPVGAAVVVAVYDTNLPASGMGVTDSKGNTYSLLANISPSSNNNSQLYVSFLTTALAISDVISYSSNAAVSHFCDMSCAAVTGYINADTAYSNSAGSSSNQTTFSVAGATLAQYANELNFGTCTAAGVITITPTADWTNVTDPAITAHNFGLWFEVNPVVGPLIFGGALSPGATNSQCIAALVPFAPFNPQPRSKLMTLQQRPHSIGLAPTPVQGARITIPLVLTSVLSGTANKGTVASGDLTMEDAEGIINNVQTMFVDASGMPFPMRLFFPETQQTIFISAQSQGYYPFAVGSQGQIQASAFSASGQDVANVSISIQFLNVPIEGVIWVAEGVPT